MARVDTNLIEVSIVLTESSCAGGVRAVDPIISDVAYAVSKVAFTMCGAVALALIQREVPHFIGHKHRVRLCKGRRILNGDTHPAVHNYFIIKSIVNCTVSEASERPDVLKILRQICAAISTSLAAIPTRSHPSRLSNEYWRASTAIQAVQ